ncbi:MAG TPA: hypothetical protein VGQ20_15015 [Acidimicrobiales bacterium]|jgi:hypothetical protein|nr:hypothetical protein [Acidimicrobiales bacterium]
MTVTDWACAPSDRAAPRSMLDDLVTAGSAAEQTDLLAEWGSFVRGLEDSAAFVATAANCGRVPDGLAITRPPGGGATPRDRDASHARVVWYTASALVRAGALGADQPDRSLDHLTIDLSGRAGLTVDWTTLDRFLQHEAARRAAVEDADPATLLEELRAEGTRTAQDVAADGLLDAEGSQRALASAYGALAAARVDRDRAEAAAVELAASRALVRELGDELERDEWIRARLRRVKATAPMRALIAARKRLRRRGRRD